jgi:hypothetical protein
MRALRTLLLVALLGVVAGGAYIVATDTSRRTVQLKEDVQGDVQQAVDEIKALIDENVR